jgi:hypothetical protein
MNAKTNEMLVELNDLRQALGEKPLKSWKKSTGELIDLLVYKRAELSEAQNAVIAAMEQKDEEPAAEPVKAKKGRSKKSDEPKAAAAEEPKSEKPKGAMYYITNGDAVVQFPGYSVFSAWAKAAGLKPGAIEEAGRVDEIGERRRMDPDLAVKTGGYRRTTRRAVKDMGVEVLFIETVE